MARVGHSMLVRTLCAAALAVVCSAGTAIAGEIQAVVKDQRGAPLQDAVVVALPTGGTQTPLPVKAGREAVGQTDMEFVPYVKALTVGTALFFPNNDSVRHHVYSFSPAKTFELPLYVGTPANPVVFDRPGIVTIGCNIHDWMIGYIYVADTPYVATTSKKGTVKLANVPPGSYAVRVWHPRMDGTEESTSRSVTIEGSAVTSVAWQVAVGPELRRRRPPTSDPRAYDYR
jgi:plastocyanin